MSKLINIQVGERVRIVEDISSVNGVLYKDTIVKVDGFSQNVDNIKDTIRVVDSLGKIWWVESSKLSNKFS